MLLQVEVVQIFFIVDIKKLDLNIDFFNTFIVHQGFYVLLKYQKCTFIAVFGVDSAVLLGA